MKNFLRNPIIIWSFVILILFGTLLNDSGQKEFLDIYIGKMSTAPIRYVLLIIVLFIDYIIFENMNHYTIICRYKSMDHFIIKITIREIAINSIVFTLLHLPLLILNFNFCITNIGAILLFIFNAVIVVSLFTAIIRVVNIWVSNRALSSAMVFSTYALIDFVLENIGFVFIKQTMFDFQEIFIIPYIYTQSYLFIAIVIAIVIVLITLTTAILITKNDYILKHNEDF